MEHIGSTAIPGVAAKPIVDLAVRVESLDEVMERFNGLAQVGWLRIVPPPPQLIRSRSS